LIIVSVKGGFSLLAVPLEGDSTELAILLENRDKSPLTILISNIFSITENKATWRQKAFAVNTNAVTHKKIDVHL